jgi:hypothetical protein
MANDVLAFSIIGAASLSEACGKAKGCPVLGSGGTVFVLRGDAHWMTVERVFGAAHRRNEFSS